VEIAAASFPGIYLMGMCSRQERIQKDIDVVIQKSRAEKDCLFAGEFLPLGSWDQESASPLSTPIAQISDRDACSLGVWGGKSPFRVHLEIAAAA
jgi:hypothetical protein